MAESLTLELPIPPSANDYWRSIALPGIAPKTARNPQGWGARVLLSDEARGYRVTVEAAFRRQLGFKIQPLEGDLRLTVTWRRARRAGDISNRIKVVEDCLEGLAYLNDRQVAEVHAYRVDGAEPGMTILVERLAGAAAASQGELEGLAGVQTPPAAGEA